MITDQQLDALETAALAWKDRPERRCQFGMGGIYIDAGLLPAALEIPDGPRDWARAEGRSLIAPWIESCGYFVEVDVAMPGDLLGFRLGRILHHVAIQLRDGRMVHVFGHHGVQIAPCIPDEWASRLEKIWRLK